MIDFGVQGSITPGGATSGAEASTRKMETYVASLAAKMVLNHQKKQSFENCVEDWGHNF